MTALLARKERERLSYSTLEDETGISRHTLAAWASRLRRESQRNERPRFVELVATEVADDRDTAIEIVLGAQVLRVRRGFDEATLSRVIILLRSSC